MNSKKNRIVLALGALILLVSGVAQAGIFDFTRDRTVTVRYRLSTAANVSTAAVVIDLSNTTDWPHKEDGEINITSVRVELDKLAASTATVKLGVVNFVDSSTGSITWFYNKSLEVNASNAGVVDFVNYAPNAVRLRVEPGSGQTDGATPYLYSNDKTSGSTAYQTDVKLPSLLTTGVAPGFGDLILHIGNGTGAVVANVEIQYQGEKR